MRCEIEIGREIGGGDAARGGRLQLSGLQRQRVCSLQRACSPQLHRLQAGLGFGVGLSV